MPAPSPDDITMDISQLMLPAPPTPTNLATSELQPSPDGPLSSLYPEAKCASIAGKTDGDVLEIDGIGDVMVPPVASIGADLTQAIAHEAEWRHTRRQFLSSCAPPIDLDAVWFARKRESLALLHAADSLDAGALPVLPLPSIECFRPSHLRELPHIPFGLMLGEKDHQAVHPTEFPATLVTALDAESNDDSWDPATTLSRDRSDRPISKWLLGSRSNHSISRWLCRIHDRCCSEDRCFFSTQEDGSPTCDYCPSFDPDTDHPCSA